MFRDIERHAEVVFRSIEALSSHSRTDAQSDDAAAMHTVTTAPLDTTGARAALKRLQAALGDVELSAANAALADLAALGVSAGGAAADFTRLRDRVDTYDYDEAQVIVARLVEQFERTTPP